MTQTPETLEILTLNIGNPSLQRAERQLDWLAGRGEHVLVLTETAPSRGCDLIAERLSQARWEVRFPRPVEGERGVMIASRVRLAERGDDLVGYLPARAERALIVGAMLEIVGLYVPSRDASAGKTERKRRFLQGLSDALAVAPATGVLIGDLNIIEPGHRPHYAWFQDWEYEFYSGLLDSQWVDAYRLCSPNAMEHSWVSYDGDGYRYDHVLVSAELAERVVQCGYLHETRENSLTDHSAMMLTLQLEGARRLEVEEGLSAEPATLF
jgi:exodeoxyribonuclease-3